MSKLIAGRDITGAVIYSIPIASLVIDCTLTGAIPQSLVTPSGFNTVFITSQIGVDLYVSINNNGASAAYPSTSFTINASNTELNPTIRQIDPRGGQTISVLTRNDGDVSIRFDYAGA